MNILKNKKGFLGWLILVIILILAVNIKSQEYIEPYKVWFDYENKLPIKVEYTYIHSLVKIERTNYFKQDSGTLHPNQYKGSKYDRGHLFPAAKAKTKQQMVNSFNMKNVAPQHPSLNRGIWRKLESYVENRSICNDSIQVITGYIQIESYIGDLPIPMYFYKTLKIWEEGEVIIETFLFKNKKPEFSDLEMYRLN